MPWWLACCCFLVATLILTLSLWCNDVCTTFLSSHATISWIPSKLASISTTLWSKVSSCPWVTSLVSTAILMLTLPVCMDVRIPRALDVIAGVQVAWLCFQGQSFLEILSSNWKCYVYCGSHVCQPRLSGLVLNLSQMSLFTKMITKFYSYCIVCTKILPLLSNSQILSCLSLYHRTQWEKFLCRKKPSHSSNSQERTVWS